jgi:hypothetical protein
MRTVSRPSRGPRLTEGGFDEREQLRFEASLLAVCQRSQWAAEQDGEAVNGSPGGVFDVRAARWVQQSSGDEVVEGRFEVVERPRLVVYAPRRVLGCRERGVEEARLRAGEIKVGDADGPKPR